MASNKLKDIDPEDFEFFLREVESSFGIWFENYELAHISTLGEFCDYISDKIQLQNIEDCTSQQAFYKLRKAISEVLEFDSNEILPNTLLVKLLPRETRKVKIKELEKELGFDLKLLRPPHWISNSLFFLILASLPFIFLNKPLGLYMIVFSILGLITSGKLENELDESTIADLTKKITRQHYLLSRRDQNTFNKAEIESLLIDWIGKCFAVDKKKLTRDAQFAWR
jgi:hypothetical protein